MIISSRTPEGEPAKCPLCLSAVVVEPSVFFGDATCPRCGQLLWFIQTGDETRLFDAQQSSGVRNRVLALVANQLGIAPDQIPNQPDLLSKLGADSLDTVELVMELEEELGLG